MKRFVLTCVLFALTHHSFGGNLPRTIADYPEAREFLRRTTTPQFYRSLLHAPLNGWVTVRGDLSGDRLLAPRVVRSDTERVFSDLALDLARNLQVLGDNIQRQHSERGVLLHVLVYDIADGRLAVSFSHFDEPGAAHMRNHGAAWMAVLKNNAQWITIDPAWHLVREHRGPRSYAFFAQEPGVPQRYRGTGVPMQPGLANSGVLP